MSSLKLLHFLFGIIIFILPYYQLMAETEEGHVNKKTIYIGVPENRHPYSYKNKKQKTTGVLIEKISDICVKLELRCIFSSGSFQSNLQKLQELRIDALLITDSVILPEKNNYKFTSPLCKSNFIFTKKVRLSIQKEVADDELKGKKIGVTKDSLFYFYALEHYSGFANIKPYETLEAGVFDLFVGRIDFIFTEEAFYNSRIGSTLLGHRHGRFRLTKLKNESIKLSGNTMTLAIRSNDAELWDQMASAITKKDAAAPCTTLLNEAATDDKEKPSDDTDSPKENKH